jgi:hypothetical protein
MILGGESFGRSIFFLKIFKKKKLRNSTVGLEEAFEGFK